MIVKWYVIVVLNYISLMTKDVEHFLKSTFVYLLWESILTFSGSF